MFDRVEIDLRVFPKAHVRVFKGDELVHNFKDDSIEKVISEVIINIKNYEDVVEVLEFLMRNQDLCLLQIGDGNSVITIHLDTSPDEQKQPSEAQKEDTNTRSNMAAKKPEIEYVAMKNPEKSALLEEYADIQKQIRELEKRKDEIKNTLVPSMDSLGKDKLFFQSLGGRNFQLLRQTRVGSIQIDKIKNKYGATDEDIEALRAADSVSWVIKENTK